MFRLCRKCLKLKGGLFLVFAILFLLRDLNVWNFWNIQWWTVAFLLIGIAALIGSSCPECVELNKK